MQGSYYNKCRVLKNRSITGNEWGSAETARRFLVPCCPAVNGREALMFLMMSGTED